MHPDQGFPLPPCPNNNKIYQLLESSIATSEIETLKQGDTKAFDDIFRSYYQPLCIYAKKILQGDPMQAEDIVQQTFVKLWETRTKIDIQTSLKSYLYKSVHNTALNKLRHLKTKTKYQEHALRQLELHRSYQPEAHQELSQKIQAAISSLPKQCRYIFELSRFEELKYREIADQLQISVKTVETQMGKALKILRSQLAEYLVALFLLYLSISI